MSAVSLRLPEELAERLDRLSRKTGRSKSFYMLEAIRERIEDLEDWYLAEERMIAHREGRSKSYTQSEMEHEFGLADRVRPASPKRAA
jgi:RHH-type rel operon transcriptional repressor/antitoxin RelB